MSSITINGNIIVNVNITSEELSRDISNSLDTGRSLHDVPDVFDVFDDLARALAEHEGTEDPTPAEHEGNPAPEVDPEPVEEADVPSQTPPPDPMTLGNYFDYYNGRSRIAVSFVTSRNSSSCMAVSPTPSNGVYPPGYMLESSFGDIGSVLVEADPGEGADGFLNVYVNKDGTMKVGRTVHSTPGKANQYRTEGRAYMVVPVVRARLGDFAPLNAISRRAHSLAIPDGVEAPCRSPAPASCTDSVATPLAGAVEQAGAGTRKTYELVICADEDGGASGGFSVVRPASSVFFSVSPEAKKALQSGLDNVRLEEEFDAVLATRGLVEREEELGSPLYVNVYTDDNTIGRTVHNTESKAEQYASSTRPSVVVEVWLVS